MLALKGTTMDLSSPFSIGDIVMNSDKTSPFYRRDSIVVYNDYSIFAVMSEGVGFISFFSVVDEGFTLVRKGEGKGSLTKDQQVMLNEILKNWAPVQLLKPFPTVLAKQRDNIVDKDEKMVPLHITAFIPETMARIFREFSALLEMSRSVNPGFEGDSQKMILEWCVLSITSIMPLMLSHHIRESHEKENEEEGENG